MALHGGKRQNDKGLFRATTKRNIAHICQQIDNLDWTTDKDISYNLF